MKIKIYCYRYGWVMGFNPVTGLRFTQQKEGAKPFEPESEELEDVCIWIEHNLMTSYIKAKEMPKSHFSTNPITGTEYYHGFW